MAARGATLLAGGFVTGLAIALAIAATPSGRDLLSLGNTDTGLSLRDVGGTCTLTGKETEVVVQKNKKLTWDVRNFCAQAQTVSVGNFRTTPQTANGNCSAVTEGDARSPFQQDDEARRTVSVGAGSAYDPEKGKVQLKVRSRGDLGGEALTFYFSLCLGSGGNQRVVDPRLVIER